ncbi:unnamed protein product [Linum tenue]|uniref:S1-like domain-containing protein n=1 Tax=Linum tenue TaxID=586396 RepID=A0AAV0JCT7_9ROSI|nr:unnamed protein product [Linum tenue]
MSPRKPNHTGPLPETIRINPANISSAQQRRLRGRQNTQHRRKLPKASEEKAGGEKGERLQDCAELSFKGKMKGGRKNLKRAAANEDSLTIQDGQSIMRVLSLRGSNLIEVMDTNGEKSLALFPAKFQKSMWIKNGSFVVVDGSGKEKAIESGSKVTCMVSRVLFHEHVRKLQKSPEWPENFKEDNINGRAQAEAASQEANQLNSCDEEEEEDDDGLPPLEANMNRVKPPFMDSGSGSDSDS